MKRILSLFIFMAALSAASAQTYSYLTLKGSDGSEESFSLKQMKLTFQGSQITVTNADGQKSFDLSSLSLMRFDAEPTAIRDVELSGAYTSAGPDAVYTIDGRRLQGAQPGRLPRGLYIIRQNGQSRKVYVR